MSNISNRHQIVKFVAGKSQAFSGQRLAKCGYKSSKKQQAKFPSVCASLPTLDLNAIVENAERLAPYVRGMLENAQDGILRSLYESSGGQRDTIGDDEIGIDQCIAYLESENSGGRLTIEGLETWFDAQIRDNLTVILCEKLQIEDVEDSRVVQQINGFRGLIASLAGMKNLLNDGQIGNIRKALDLADNEDDTHKKLIARLDAMQSKPKIEELLKL